MTDLIVGTAEASRLLKRHRMTLDKQLKAGVYKHARKVGGRWLINLSREYPELFGEEEAADAGTSTATS